MLESIEFRFRYTRPIVQLSVVTTAQKHRVLGVRFCWHNNAHFQNFIDVVHSTIQFTHTHTMFTLTHFHVACMSISVVHLALKNSACRSNIMHTTLFNRTAGWRARPLLSIERKYKSNLNIISISL